MPILSMFYGIVLRMYFFDDKQHHVPHVHAEYAGKRAVFSITRWRGVDRCTPIGKGSIGTGVDRDSPRRTAGRLAIGCEWQRSV
jgi:hypothetical protein